MTDFVPQGNYCLYSEANGIVFSAGVTPRVNGQLTIVGKLGESVSLSQGKEAARVCANRLLDELESTGHSVIPLHMTVYVACTDAFTMHSQLADQCSEVVEKRCGSVPPRVAVGVASLPGGSPVELTIVGWVRGTRD